MGTLIDGRRQIADRLMRAEAFVRRGSVFRGRLTEDDSAGFAAPRYRYQLYVSLACSRAGRTAQCWVNPTGIVPSGPVFDLIAPPRP